MAYEAITSSIKFSFYIGWCGKGTDIMRNKRKG